MFHERSVEYTDEILQLAISLITRFEANFGATRKIFQPL